MIRTTLPQNGANEVRDRSVPDSQGRLHLDPLPVSHLDEDHPRGLRKHSHLGPPAEWSSRDDKIQIGEIWSSLEVFRRAFREHVLCDDERRPDSRPW